MAVDPASGESGHGHQVAGVTVGTGPGHGRGSTGTAHVPTPGKETMIVTVVRGNEEVEQREQQEQSERGTMKGLTAVKESMTGQERETEKENVTGKGEIIIVINI